MSTGRDVAEVRTEVHAQQTSQLMKRCCRDAITRTNNVRAGTGQNSHHSTRLRRVCRARSLVAVVLSSALACAAHAFTYPEHRNVSAVAVQELDADRQAALTRLWEDARVGDESRLCAAVVDTNQGLA